jgi:hypothetical protein
MHVSPYPLVGEATFNWTVYQSELHLSLPSTTYFENNFNLYSLLPVDRKPSLPNSWLATDQSVHLWALGLLPELGVLVYSGWAAKLLMNV